MTVFKGYLKILKKNLGMLLIYLVIFFAIAIALQASARKEHLGTFEKTRINVAVADRDQSELSRGLIRYLSTIHNVSEISSEPSVMQEELFYRNTSYIVQIPENLYQTCIEKEEPLSVTKVPGSYTSFYVDQQISTWLNSIRTYTAAGFSLKEAMDASMELPASEVTMYEGTKNNLETPPYIYYFRYVPYLFLAVLSYSMGYVLLTFQKEDILKRMRASAVSLRRQNMEGLLAMFMLGAVLWLISVAGVCVLFGKEFLTSPLIGYYILNTALMLGIALSLSYLVGIFVKNSNMLSGISNLLSLGMCFLCGAFVPMSIMNKSVLKIAQFLPVYWYESINETLAQYKTLPVPVAEEIWKSMGIEAMFIAAFVFMILAISKYKQQG